MNTFPKISLFVLIMILLSACSIPMAPGYESTIEDAKVQATQIIQTARAEAEDVAVEPTARPESAPRPEESSGETAKSGDWNIQYFDGATTEMKDWSFNSLAPADWTKFPNVDNGEYPASQGVEYGEDLSAFCQQDQTCDFNVAARHYRLYTGDYSLEGVGECEENGSGAGCALLVVNVGEVTAIYRDQHFDYGFTVTGRYWDGNFLPQAMWAVMSHASANMLNMATSLNPGGTNAGANCSVPGGCKTVEATFVVTSGNEILMIGRSTVSR